MPSDTLGNNWGEVGTITFADTDWHYLASPTIGGEIFRFAYAYDARRWHFREGYRSWIWLRFRWGEGVVDGNVVDQISPARKLWPKPEIEVREFPIPQELKDAGLTVRDIQVRLRPYGRSRWPHQTAIPITLKVEERLN